MNGKKKESILTSDSERCYFCGRPAHGVHHLIFGAGMRNLADDDQIFIPICDMCHMYGHIDDEMGLGFAKESRIHDNPMAEKLSKMLGQAVWEMAELAKHDPEVLELTKTKFRKRYGRSYL